MKVKSLGDFIREYSIANPNDVYQVDEDISINYEATAYYRCLEKKNPLILFRSIADFPEFNMVTNTLGSSKRMAFALDTDHENLYRKWEEVMAGNSDIKTIEGSSPIGEVIQTGDDIDLFSLPAPVHFTEDGSIEGFNRYISGGLAIARDPDNPETINMSFTRIQLVSRDRYAFDMGSHGHLWSYVHNAEKKGVNLPVTVLIGAHPIFYMLAASFMENEYSHASYLGDFRYASGKLNDIPVPADGEIAIEAEVMAGERFREGPFSEFTGYMSARSTGNMARVKSIMRRKKAIFYDIAGSNSHEHVGLFSIPRNAFITRGIKQYLPPSGKYQVEWPLSSSHLVALCNVVNPEPGISKQLGLAIAGMDALFTKIIFISEGCTQVPTLEKAILGLAGSRLREGYNVQLIPEVFTIKLDPASSREGTNGKAILICDSIPEGYSRVAGKGTLKLYDGKNTAIISHSEQEECGVNVIVDPDISLEDPDSVMWAIATRTRPDRDIRVVSGRLIIDARSKTSQTVPEIPAKVMQIIKKRLGETPC